MQQFLKKIDVKVVSSCLLQYKPVCVINFYKLETWVNAQRDGRPAEYRSRPLFNAAKFG